jgi:hypothetical protein
MVSRVLQAHKVPRVFLVMLVLLVRKALLVFPVT